MFDCAARLLSTSPSREAARHRLQNLTDEYLNEPHAAAQNPQHPPQDDDTWCPSDPPPLSESLPPLQGDSPAYAAAEAVAETEERVSPFEYARLNHTEPLAAWVCSHGGYINTALEIGMSPTLGCRGVITKDRLGQLGDNEALIIVPQDLAIDALTAKEGLSVALSSQTIDKMEPKSRLALFLAMERRRGVASFWEPYIRSLPFEVPCGWAIKPKAAAAAVKQHGSQIGKALLKKEAKKATDLTRKLHSQFGASLKLSLEDIQWAFGTVDSRNYRYRPPLPGGQLSEHEQPVLLPYLDVCNHSSDGLEIALGRSGLEEMWVNCIVHTPEHPVKEDLQEVMVDYFSTPMSATHRFLVFGFV